METFRIRPVLGMKTDVPADDFSLFKPIGDNIALTHDVGGINFSTSRERNTCSKSYGALNWSSAADSEASRCLGLFNLVDGTSSDYIMMNNGSFYLFGSNLSPTVVADAGATTFATDATDLYSMIRYGSYVVFADMGEHTPYKWKSGNTMD